ncbi:MAG: sugar phosphate nucleotidyltransferase [Candidatus Hinthialibacter antarcticus]|nr:sugar phosphate nucleotidyltransferase [Candidatus Hinthialibacter antarcticus]
MQAPLVTIIMAGGSGERFWPLSRRRRPKQLLRLVDDSESMLERCVRQWLPLSGPEHLFIATNESLAEPIQAQLPDFPTANILSEPTPRNTAGCLAFAAAHLLARWGDEALKHRIAIISADIYIGDDDALHQTVHTALQAAVEHDAIAVLGIEPVRAETGFGYIEISDREQPDAVIDDMPVYSVHSFREKPDHNTAVEYIQSNRFLWNSGLFFWKLSTFIEELENVAPAYARAIEEMRDALQQTPPDAKALNEAFERMPSQSIDKALLEHAQSVYMVPAKFSWNDIGTWSSLAQALGVEEEGLNSGDPVLIDCKNVTVINQAGAEQMAVGVVGLENVIVVATEDGVLVCRKDRAQDVRRVVAELKHRDAPQV